MNTSNLRRAALLASLVLAATTGCENQLVQGCATNDECGRGEQCVSALCVQRADSTGGGDDKDAGTNPNENQPPFGPFPSDCTLFTLGSNNYTLCSKPRTFADAVETCNSMGGPPAQLDDNDDSITNEAEVRELQRRAEAFPGGSYWIGLTDLENKGQFAWLRGVPLEKSRFADGQPDDNGGEDCVQVIDDANAEWNDVDCSLPGAVVCEPKSGGFQAVPSGCIVDSGYMFCSNRVPFSTAQTVCTTSNGSLLELDPVDANGVDTERAIVRRLAATHPAGRYWLGLTDSVKEGTFSWLSFPDRAAGVTRFSAGQPDNANGEDCVIAVAGGTWFDVQCNELEPVICEFRGFE